MAAQILGTALFRRRRSVRSPAQRCHETIEVSFSVAPPPVAEDVHRWSLPIRVFGKVTKN